MGFTLIGPCFDLALPTSCHHLDTSTASRTSVRHNSKNSLPTWTFYTKFSNVVAYGTLTPLFFNVGSIMQPVIIPAGSTRCFDFESRSEERGRSSWNIFFNVYELFSCCAHIYKQRLSWNKPQLATKLQPDSSVPSYSYLLWGDCVLPWAPFTTVMEI